MLDLEEFNECCFVKLDNSLSLLNVVSANIFEFDEWDFEIVESLDLFSLL